MAGGESSSALAVRTVRVIEGRVVAVREPARRPFWPVAVTVGFEMALAVGYVVSQVVR